MINHASRPKIGLALSGGSGRAITHVAVLEVFKENNIPIDYITAVSSGAIIAGSYACGTLEQFRNDWLNMDKGFFFSLFEISMQGKGMFNTRKIEAWFYRYMAGRRLEESNPRLSFMAVDLNTKQSCMLSLGDVRRAARASCAVPGLFEPVAWGSKLLADGGLISVVPAKEVREMGADIVIGVDILSRTHMFTPRTLHFRKAYRALKALVASRLGRVYAFAPAGQREHNIFSILGQAMDIVIAVDKRDEDYAPHCDVVISPGVKHYDKLGLGKSQKMYETGRAAAMAVVPRIRKLMLDFESRKIDV